MSDRDIAERAIQRLVHRYALLVRSNRGAECAALFTLDGLFETNQPLPDAEGEWLTKRAVGRAAIADHIGGSGVGQRLYPAVSNLLIDVDSDRASSTCLMRVVVAPSGAELIGDYEDSYVREDDVGEDGWLFASRVYRLHWTRRP